MNCTLATELVRAPLGIGIDAFDATIEPVPPGADGLLVLPFFTGERTTWVGSMMTHLWVYDGVLDAAGKVLNLDTVGPDMSGGMAKFQDVYEFKSNDHRVLTSHMLGADGKWSSFMTANYWRKK
jgi:hypothetical protein